MQRIRALQAVLVSCLSIVTHSQVIPHCLENYDSGPFGSGGHLPLYMRPQAKASGTQQAEVLAPHDIMSIATSRDLVVTVTWRCSAYLCRRHSLYTLNNFPFRKWSCGEASAIWETLRGCAAFSINCVKVTLQCIGQLLIGDPMLTTLLCTVFVFLLARLCCFRGAHQHSGSRRIYCMRWGHLAIGPAVAVPGVPVDKCHISARQPYLPQQLQTCNSINVDWGMP